MEFSLNINARNALLAPEYLIELKQLARVQEEAVDFREQRHHRERQASAHQHVVEEHPRHLAKRNYH